MNETMRNGNNIRSIILQEHLQALIDRARKPTPFTAIAWGVIIIHVAFYLPQYERAILFFELVWSSP